MRLVGRSLAVKPQIVVQLSTVIKRNLNNVLWLVLLNVMILNRERSRLMMNRTCVNWLMLLRRRESACSGAHVQLLGLSLSLRLDLLSMGDLRLRLCVNLSKVLLMRKVVVRSRSLASRNDMMRRHRHSGMHTLILLRSKIVIVIHTTESTKVLLASTASSLSKSVSPLLFTANPNPPPTSPPLLNPATRTSPSLTFTDKLHEFATPFSFLNTPDTSTGTPFISFGLEGLELGVKRRELETRKSALTSLRVNEGDRRVDDRALRGTTDRGEIWEKGGKILRG